MKKRSVPQLAVLALAACAQAQASTPAPAPAPFVHLAAVESGAAPPMRAVGTLAGKSEIRLSFKNGGTVEALLVEAGTRVHRGQVLATLNHTEIASQLSQAQAAAAKAHADFARIERLEREGTASKASYDAVKTALEVADGQVAIARYNREVAEIVAPEDGVIEKRLVEAHELVSPGQTVYTLRGANRGVVLRVGLTDKDLLTTPLGTAAEIRFGALPDQTFRGEVTELAQAANAHTGTFEAEIRIDSNDPRLLPGLVGNAAISRRAAPVAWVPIEALLEQDGMSASVYTLDGTSPPRAQKRKVEIAYLDGSHAAVSHGLDGVTQVVTDGASDLTPGGTVHLVP